MRWRYRPAVGRSRSGTERQPSAAVTTGAGHESRGQLRVRRQHRRTTRLIPVPASSSAPSSTRRRLSELTRRGRRLDHWMRRQRCVDPEGQGVQVDATQPRHGRAIRRRGDEATSPQPSSQLTLPASMPGPQLPPWRSPRGHADGRHPYLGVPARRLSAAPQGARPTTSCGGFCLGANVSALGVAATLAGE